MSAGLRDLAVDRPARKGLPVFVACAVALLLAVAASLLYGSQPVPAVDVLAYLRGQQGNLVEANASVMALRVPRTVLGLVCGISLGVAGALCQAHTRNPLADPGLLGVSSGAAAGVVLAISVFHLVSPAQYTVFGLLGGLVAGSMVLGLAARIRLANAATSLILAGSIITGVLNAVSSAVVLLDKVTMDRFRYWTVGSLSGRDASVLWDVGPWLALGLLLTVLNTSSLDALALGDDVASSLGRNVIRDRLVGLLAVVVLASAATASMGAIAFPRSRGPAPGQADCTWRATWRGVALRSPGRSYHAAGRYRRPAGAAHRRAERGHHAGYSRRTPVYSDRAQPAHEESR